MNSKNATSIDQNADSSNIALPLNESETKYQRLYQNDGRCDCFV